MVSQFLPGFSLHARDHPQSLPGQAERPPAPSKDPHPRSERGADVKSAAATPAGFVQHLQSSGAASATETGGSAQHHHPA